MSNPVSPLDESTLMLVKDKNKNSDSLVKFEENTHDIAQKILNSALIPNAPDSIRTMYIIAPPNVISMSSNEMMRLKRTLPLREHEDIPEEILNLPRMRLKVLEKFHEEDATPADKLEILEKIYNLVISDPLTSESADKLLQFIVQLLALLNREKFQMETAHVQIGLAKLFSASATLLMQHQAKENINGITTELKLSLADTIKGLEGLNRIESTKLAYYLEMSLQGILRLADDNNELVKSFKKFSHSIYHTALAAGSYFLSGINASEELKKVWLDVKSVKSSRTASWYDYTMLLQVLSKEAKKDIRYLLLMQEYIEEKASKLDWRFLYTAIKLLADVVLEGENPVIRTIALEGNPLNNTPSPGLMTLTKYNQFSSKIDFSRTSHFGLPQCTSSNGFIQEYAVNQIITLSKTCTDHQLRDHLKKFLQLRSENERNEEITTAIQNYLSQHLKADAWTDEVYGLSKTKKKLEKREKRLSDTREIKPRRSSENRQRRLSDKYDPREANKRSSVELPRENF